jgi:hypothetical protein
MTLITRRRMDNKRRARLLRNKRKNKSNQSSHSLGLKLHLRNLPRMRMKMAGTIKKVRKMVKKKRIVKMRKRRKKKSRAIRPMILNLGASIIGEDAIRSALNVKSFGLADYAMMKSNIIKRWTQRRIISLTEKR